MIRLVSVDVVLKKHQHNVNKRQQNIYKNLKIRTNTNKFQQKLLFLIFKNNILSLCRIYLRY